MIDAVNWHGIGRILIPILVGLGSYGVGADRGAVAETSKDEVLRVVRDNISEEIGKAIEASVAKEMTPMRTILQLLSKRLDWTESRIAKLEPLPADATPSQADPEAECPPPFVRDSDGWCRPCSATAHWTEAGCVRN